MAHAGPLAKATAPAASMQEKGVYYVNDSANASAALRNIRNHLSAAPDAKIVVATHSEGISPTPSSNWTPASTPIPVLKIA
jgi:hypothetical protein